MATSFRQRQADALSAIAEASLAPGLDGLNGLSVGDRHLVQVHVNLSALAGGHDPLDDEDAGRCHIDEGPALPRDVARRLACDGGVVAIFEDAAGKTLDVGRKTRAIPSAMRRALASRDAIIARSRE